MQTARILTQGKVRLIIHAGSIRIPEGVAVAERRTHELHIAGSGGRHIAVGVVICVRLVA
jgi:hypothetical protein